MGIFSKLKHGLKKTRLGFTSQMTKLFTGSEVIDEDFYEELEDILIGADVGVDTTMKIVEGIRDKVVEAHIKYPKDVNQLLREELIALLRYEDMELAGGRAASDELQVILVVGVNGVGKTTSIGKIAHRLKQQNHKVLLAAGDTFRAAAIDQLQIWGERTGIDVVKHKEGADPAAVIYDGLQAARARNIDYLICDTAGRLHSNANLVDEMKKIVRVAQPDLKVFVGESTTGNDCIEQAQRFNDAIGIDGIILAKTDVDSKGGAAISVSYVTGKPIIYIGTGQDYNDLTEFDPKLIAENLGLST